MRMPTSGTRRAARPAESGFTLIELLAVLAILAIAVTAFTYAGRGSLDAARFRAFMVKTSAAMQEARADAMRSMEEKVFYIDLNRRVIGDFKSSQVLRLPEGVGLTATVAQSESYDGGVLGIRFYPAGHTSGGTLSFTFRNQTYEIRVNWLTGNVASHRV